MALKEKSFSQCTAEILNLFFSAGLSDRDVEFCIGRYHTKLLTMSHRMTIAENWHNLDGDFERSVQALVARMEPSGDHPGRATNWARIAVRIATLFGIFSDLLRQGTVSPENPMDVAVCCGDFSGPMAVWYARAMGLPIRNIIAGDDESRTWDLIHHGEVRTDGIQPDLERLVYGTLGFEENQVFLKSRIYTVPEGSLESLRQGVYAAVVSRQRIMEVIPSVYHTSGYLLGPWAAMAYGGLMNYRAKTGESGEALILTEQSPLLAEKLVARAMDLPVETLRQLIQEN